MHKIVIWNTCYDNRLIIWAFEALHKIKFTLLVLIMTEQEQPAFLITVIPV